MVGKFPPQNISHPHVIFSGICRAIPQTLVAQKPLDYAVQGKKKQQPGNSGSLFLAGDVQVWLLKVAAVAAVVVVEAPIPRCWMLFWGKATPCLPEESLKSIIHPSIPPRPSIRPPRQQPSSSTRASELLMVSLWPFSNSLYMNMCVSLGEEVGVCVDCSLNR